MDKSLFFLVNNGMANPFFDLVMPFITQIRNVLPLLIAASVYLVIKGGKRGRVAVVVLILSVTFADLFNHEVLKELFARYRPCDPRSGLIGVRALFGEKTSFSFPSNHGANISALAVAISFYYRKWLIPMILLAILISFTRVYVGVHYPLDVLAGAVVGVITGGLVLLAAQRVIPVEADSGKKG